MKKLLFYIIFLSFIALLASCGKEPNPKDIFQAYVQAWENNDFSSMYQYLCVESKKAISEKDFVQKYTGIYQGIKAKNIRIETDYPKTLKPDKEGILIVPFTVTIDTSAGEIKSSNRFSLKVDQLGDIKSWGFVWTSRMIFPNLGEDEKVRIEKKDGIRGEILDREGIPLAVNGVVAEIGIVPGKLGQDAASSKKQIAGILNIQSEVIDKKLSASYVKPDMFIPIRSISKDETAKINSLLKISGVMVNDKKSRVYPLKEKAAHLIGYIQSINAEELEKLSSEGYSKNDVIGKTGLEKIYEKTLRSESGAEIYIVDKSGKKKEILAKKEPKDGKDLKLTIDSSIQGTLYDELKADAGTGAAMHPKTGEVLALVSTPAYDPNSFILGMSDNEWKALNENPKKPLTNRFQKTFCPGSTFKPVTAAIALKTNKLNPDTIRNISGLKWQNDKKWGNYFVTRVSAYTEPANLINAMMHSDNIYFAQTALDIGIDDFLAEAKNFGIGEKIPFEYGLYNSQFTSDGTIKSEIQLADSGYGQGEILINPLHLAAIYSSFINKGNIISPYLEFKAEISPTVWKENVFSSDISDTVLQDLSQVIENPSGSGHQAYIKGIPIAGKTGTAEIKLNQEDKNGTELGWFAAMNTDNPRLMVLMMVEDVKNRGGSHYVVPMAKKIFEAFIK